MTLAISMYLLAVATRWIPIGTGTQIAAFAALIVSLVAVKLTAS